MLDQRLPDLEALADFIAGSPYVDDPVGWVTDRLGETLWSKQVEIAEALATYNRVAVQSCHDVGKSYIASRLASWWLDAHPVGEAFVVTTAPTFHQVRAILWREIGRAYKAGQLRGDVNQTEWKMGDELVAFGRKPADWDPAAFQGIHARYVLVIIDEASGVPKTIWDAVETIVTNEGSKVLAIGNPDDPTSEFRRNCDPGSDLWHTITISAFESPNFTDEAVPDALRPLLISRGWQEARLQDWGEKSPLYQSKILGVFPEEGEDQLIKTGWVTAAQARWHEPDEMDLEPVEVAADIARYGTDETVLCVRRGDWISELDSYPSTSTVESAGYVASLLGSTEAIVAKIDGVGVGGGVVDQLEADGFPVADLNGGRAAEDPTRFANARAEWFWNLRKRFESGRVAIPDDTRLAAQLVSIRFKITGGGQIRIETKDEMKARGLPSPDRADTVMMAFAYGDTPYEWTWGSR